MKGNNLAFFPSPLYLKYRINVALDFFTCFIFTVYATFTSPYFKSRETHSCSTCMCCCCSLIYTYTRLTKDYPFNFLYLAMCNNIRSGHSLRLLTILNLTFSLWILTIEHHTGTVWITFSEGLVLILFALSIAFFHKYSPKNVRYF